jgi:hypothetical protein
MKRMHALAVGLAILSTATLASAKQPGEEDIQAPRGQEIQAPRADEVQAPRGQVTQTPRPDEVQAPRG